MFNKIPTLLIAVLIGGIFFVAGKNIESRQEPATITVSAEGKISAVPDIASLSFGMRTERQKTSQIAMEKLSKVMNEAIDAIQKIGIEEKDIRTESLNLYPAYDWDEGKRLPRGFEASQSLRIKVRDLEKIGEVLTAATGAGANQIGGVSFTIDNPEELRIQAREEAIANAQEKAKKLAKELGVSLGKLRNFNEGGGYNPAPMYNRAVMMEGVGMGGGAPQIPAGEQEIKVNASLTYEIR